jgi:hypothetical protein
VDPFVFLHLPTPDDLPFIPRPPESHHAFGAGLMFVGGMISAESLAGGIWHRNRARRLLFPSVLVFLGWGMIVVAFIEPNARLVHVTMGLPMIAGGWAEARYRLGQLERKYADVFIVPALVLAAFETLVFHLSGTMPIVVAHVGIASLALVIAGLRLYQSALPQSPARSLYIAAAIVAMGLILWVDAIFQ